MARPQTGSLRRIISKPAARPVTPFIAPPPLKPSELEVATRAIAQLAPSLTAYGLASERKTQREEEEAAELEIRPHVDALVGVTEEEGKKARAELEKQGLIQMTSESAIRAQAVQMGTGEGLFAKEEFKRKARNGDFNAREGPDREMIEGEDPQEVWSKLLVKAGNSYALKTGGPSATRAFNATVDTFEAEMGYIVDQIAAADRKKNVIKGAQQPMSEAMLSLSLQMAAPEDARDGERVAAALGQITRTYQTLRETGDPDWAQKGDALVIANIASVSARSGAEDALDVYEAVLETKVGGRRLGDIPEFRLSAASLESDLRRGEEAEEDRREREDARERRDAMEGAEDALALHRNELQQTGASPQTVNDALKARLFDLVATADPEHQGAVSLAGDSLIRRWREDRVEQPGTRAVHMGALSSATTPEELDEVWARIRTAHQVGEIQDSYGPLRTEYVRLGQPLTQLQASDSYKTGRGRTEKQLEKSFRYVSIEDQTAMNAEVEGLWSRFSADAVERVEDGIVNEVEVQKLYEGLRKEFNQLDERGLENKENVEATAAGLMEQGAGRPAVVRGLATIASQEVVNETAKAAASMDLKYQEMLESDPSVAFQAALSRLSMASDNDVITKDEEIRIIEDLQRQRLSVLRSIPRTTLAETRTKYHEADAALAKQYLDDYELPTDAVERRSWATWSRDKSATYGNIVDGQLAAKNPDRPLTHATSAATLLWESVEGSGTVVPERYGAHLTPVYEAGFFRGRTETMPYARDQMEYRLLADKMELGWSKKQLSAAMLATMHPLGMTLEERISGKKTLGADYPVAGVATEVSFRSAHVPAWTTPIIGLVKVTAEAMDSGAGVEQAQVKWMNQHETELRRLGKIYHMTDSDFDLWREHHKELSRTQAEYER